MGEETQSQSQPQHDSTSQPLSTTSLTETPSTDLSQNPSNPLKIPIRPLKIRKLSCPAPEDKSTALVSDDDNSSDVLIKTTATTLYQQLAYRAGTSIYTRFVALCGGEEAVRPDAVLSLSTHHLKQIGVSGRKVSYLYDLANKYQNGILSDDSVVRMDDRSLFTMLSMVKGIGSWSVHMFMIFSLHRPDVLPVSDLGVRKGVQLLYGLEDLPRPSQMATL